MNLSQYQLRALKRSWSYRESPPTIARLLRASWKTYLIQVLLLGGVASFWWFGGWQEASLLIVGILLGCIWRDVVWYSLTSKNWPLTKEVTDWRRVEDLIADNERNET